MLEVELPLEKSPEALDDYLEEGWFRNGYLLAITPIICMQGDVFVTVPIRSRLRGHTHGRSHARILRRNGERFRVKIARPEVDEQREHLYELTARRFGGFRMASLEDFLDTGPVFDFFDTWEVTVRDGDRLVASSYFDVGEKTMASLLGLYDPSYARESLGIYTMLVEMEHAKERGLSYYYPGYVLQGHDWFDYKLRLGQMQYRSEGSGWRPISRMSRHSRVRERVYARVEALEAELLHRELTFERRVYPLFWLGEMEVLPELADDYVSAPLLVECLPGRSPGERLLAEYVAEEDLYLLSLVEISERVAHHIEGVPTAEMDSDARYLADPLVRRLRICESMDPVDVADAVVELAMR